MARMNPENNVESDVGAKYIPTPSEIAAKCKEFQQSWTRQVEQSKLREDWRCPPAEIHTEIKTVKGLGH